MTNNNPVPTNWSDDDKEHNNSTYMNQQTRIAEQQQNRENNSNNINLEFPLVLPVGANSETISTDIHHQGILSPLHVLSPESSSFTSAASNYLSAENTPVPSMLYPSITPTTRQHYPYQLPNYVDPMNTFQVQAPIQQYNQQSFLSPVDQSPSSSSHENDIPRGSPRRRLSYDETLILWRDRNNNTIGGTTTAVGTSPSTIRSSIRRRETLISSRNRNVSIQRPSSVDASSQRQHYQRQSQQASSSTSSSRTVISSPTTTIDSNLLPLISSSITTTNRNTILLSQRRPQSETIITPHDFATSVSLTQQQNVHDIENNNASGTPGELNPIITTTTTTTPLTTTRTTSTAAAPTTPGGGGGGGGGGSVTHAPEDAQLLREYEDELQYLRDQWTSVCIALSSLRNMYLAVAASSSSPTSFVDLPTTTKKSSDPPQSSSSAATNTQQKPQQHFTDFPIPSSVTVTSFVGTTAPLNSNNYTTSSSSLLSRSTKQINNTSEKSSKGGKRGKGRRSDNGNEQQQIESPRGLHPDVEHEMLVGYDDAMLQLRQLQFRVEALEMEIRRLRGEPAVVQEENN
ncbi:hypothetical protein INT45_008732 [Circinella minor]|uniref:Uncharacterized protein n=1 Tax=Circinella minor TaxID=1195481 RepID=A0A8H7S6Y6_9FUNG|nr:hypothetical protein INT45_008732 [Circinella minor]